MSRIGKFNIVKMSILLNIVYRFKAISMKIPINCFVLFCSNLQVDPKIYVDTAKTILIKNKVGEFT